MKVFLATIFFIIVTIFIVAYIKISFIDLNIDSLQEKKENSKIKEEKILKLLSSTKIEKNRFPVRELYYRVDLNFKMPINIIYKVVINNFDKYKLFGIEQILQLNNIKYSIIKQGKSMKLYINFHTKTSADEVITLMKRYKIDIKMEKFFIKG